ncbi:hypothetical protein EPN90_03855 [Patescibacteria group bacterium]|nr:MAG: hypothetical protein EPN90_03855 [Patescibacteria group bacterium]
MTIFSALLSILAITGLAAVVRMYLPFRLCPICAGVSGTWAWMLVVRYFGVTVEPAILAMLLGGSVVGVTYQLEKRLPAGRSLVLFKALSIPAGFLLAYALIWNWWPVFFAGLLILAAVYFVFHRKPEAGESQEVQDLEKKLKNCC